MLHAVSLQDVYEYVCMDSTAHYVLYPAARPREHGGDRMVAVDDPIDRALYCLD